MNNIPTMCSPNKSNPINFQLVQSASTISPTNIHHLSHQPAQNTIPEKKQYSTHLRHSFSYLYLTLCHFSHT